MTTAKDTVLKSSMKQLHVHYPTLEEQAEITWKARDTEIASLEGQIADLKVLKAQAETTARQAGIKEVVEWMRANATDTHSSGVMLTFYAKEWRAKLKEWGVE